jgi:hypothetical protein
VLALASASYSSHRGSYGTIRDYVLPFREAGAAPSAVPGPPKARDLASWILTDPDNLDDDEKEKLATARERCPHLDALAGHVTEFAKILTRACTATASTHGSPPWRETTSLTCTPSPAASNTTTTPAPAGIRQHSATPLASADCQTSSPAQHVTAGGAV